jgi:predicted nucleic acid-binding protein
MKFYLDTSIWRDYYENRKDRFRPLGEWAHRLITKIIDNNYIILYSDLVIEELRHAFNLDTLIDCDIVRVNILYIHKRTARSLCKQYRVPFGDCLHAVLAKSNNAIIVTRDRHFEILSDYVTVRKPEELI